jgi:zinc transport system substrate-binding protein
MKKRLFLIFLIIFLLAGCGTLQPQQKEKTQIVATIFPLYDFAREIAGEDAEVKMLLKPGAEVHSYEPTPQDIIAIQNCDVFLYIGGESDEWVRNVLESIDTTDIQVVALMDCVDAVEEAENGFAWNGGHDHGNDEHAHEEMEYDEHIWTSPRNAVKMVKAITGALQVADHSHAAGYAERAERYTGQLTALDEALTETVNNAERKLVIFADRFPFLYLVRDYGLDYYAAYPGCSSEAEPSAATVAAIIEEVKETGVPAVFYIELSNRLMANTIAEATGAEELLLHSCQNVSREEFRKGEGYLSLMERNVKNLQRVLN